MKELTYKITGMAPLLQANPQTVDRFNPLAKEMARINAKKTRRTDDDYQTLRNLEMSAKIYWDDDMGIYIPTRWMMAALCKISNAQVKISKGEIRGSVYMKENKVKLSYRGQRNVKGAEDIIKNGDFRHLMLLPQAGKRIAKAVPIFHDWSFSGGMEYDPSVIDPETLAQLIVHAAHYGGFGDFRPTFGRASAEVTHVN